MPLGAKPLTDSLRAKRLLELIAQAVPIETCCEAVNISVRTYYRWLELGEKGVAKYAAFYKASEKAKAQWVIDNVKNVVSAGEKDWRASAWILSRRMPERFGPQSRADIRPVTREQIDWSKLSETEIQTLVELLKKAQCGEVLPGSQS